MTRIVLIAFFLFAVVLTGSTQDLSGRIIDQESKPIVNALVNVLGTDHSTISNMEGEFSISLADQEGVILEISHVSFENRRVVVDRMKDGDHSLGDVILSPSNFLMESVVVSSIRTADDEPFSFQDLDKEEIEKSNLGQDIPFLLNQTPSTVISSDAGAGIGYTSMRIRGSDASRINVTLNGVPYNDSESMQVFWVDLPDFASSTESIQIQRGVGTSSNGAGAFGATINLNTFEFDQDPHFTLANSYGSFNTRKHTVKFGTGVINDHFSLNGRLSLINSDGYVNRATSDLKSVFLNGTYIHENTILRGIVSLGKEITYQSWNGTPESRALNDETGMQDYCSRNFLSDNECSRLLSEGREYNFYTYENQVDNYRQDHYQLHLSHAFAGAWEGSAALHYTKGKGFFEQFKGDDDFADYGIADAMIGDLSIESSDIIRRRWLDNDFYGLTYSLSRNLPAFRLAVGGAWNNYVGDHFGRIIWSEFADHIDYGQRYYDNTGKKSDFSMYTKATFKTGSFSLFGDAQVRKVGYTVSGVDSDQRSLDVDDTFVFFNPKLGLNYQLNNYTSVYGSLSVANREPVRADFIDRPIGDIPLAERLFDYELGLRVDKSWTLDANLYFMDYKDQLVLTGALNDVGSNLRTNVPDSYRLGLEVMVAKQLSDHFSMSGNVNVSQNKISNFNEVIYDYTTGFDIIENNYQDVDISFSPSIVATGTLSYLPSESISIGLLNKYVGSQYLDNTSNSQRQLDAFFVQDLRLSYTAPKDQKTRYTFKMLVNNILNTQYSANGYTFSYIVEDLITENFHYPQAGRNFLIGLELGF